MTIFIVYDVMYSDNSSSSVGKCVESNDCRLSANVNHQLRQLESENCNPSPNNVGTLCIDRCQQ